MKQISSVEIKNSPTKDKKHVAIFYDKEGKKVKTTHFGAKGMSDFTINKDPELVKNSMIIYIRCSHKFWYHTNKDF